MNCPVYSFIFLRLLKPSGWRLVDVIAVATRWAHDHGVPEVEWRPEREAIKYLQEGGEGERKGVLLISHRRGQLNLPVMYRMRCIRQENGF